MRDASPVFPILMADDDPDDRLLTEKAFKEARLRNPLLFVGDGEELIDYLRRRNGYSQETAPRPGLILLDLNMPRKDGREALTEIKADPDLREIPVVVFTTSKAKEDIYRSYTEGASSFVTKPATFEGLVEAVKTIGRYWVELVSVPR